MKLLDKIKKYYSTKPKKSIWFYLFMILLLSRYTGNAAISMVMLQSGMMQPDLPSEYMMNQTARIAAESIEGLMDPLMRMFELGQELSRELPVASQWLNNWIGYIMVTLLLSILSYTLFGVIKHLAYEIYTKVNEE